MNILRKIFIILFFSAQIGVVIASRFMPMKYFCWVPYDEISLYAIEVSIGERSLSDTEIKKRYRRETPGRENRDIDNLISIIEQYESTYGRSDGAEVLLTYRSNGHEAQVWVWPK